MNVAASFMHTAAYGNQLLCSVRMVQTSCGNLYMAVVYVISPLL
jgi:hypothetical protein